MSEIYPPVGFYFTVGFDGDLETDASFKEVSGLNHNLETKEITEGGQNGFTYHLPVRTKYNELVLSRGFIPKDSDLSAWIQGTLENGLQEKIKTKDITIQLWGAERDVLCSWFFEKAYPVKWELNNLNAMTSELLVETLSFRYTRFQRS